MKTYTVKEAAKYCKCHPETIREYIRSGVLAASKPGRAYCIKAAVLDAFLDALQNHTVQASLEHRSEQKCQSIQEKMGFGTLISGRRAARELDVLLGQKTSRQPKSCTIN
ncbi:helix-turn-helix domain-containing protein [Paralysiella testudinis]|uniref:Helix-turn-helix domain-containing protein n=1 Tax=Paralysiella testudinis TaxID=2809020 RepID=A0A892ZMP6_9NEIS|nr:helix-turn-helix domain-containing protein [Paralysiella testudinis]QRQ82894.1 helix-turn-helix domain-containing protein [Paralysiella testudinis]